MECNGAAFTCCHAFQTEWTAFRSNAAQGSAEFSVMQCNILRYTVVQECN